MVQLAFEITLCLAESYLSALTPRTTVMSSFLPGAEMMTFLAPAVMWPSALAFSVKRPVDSITISTPMAFQGSSAGVLALTTLISLPLTTRMSGSLSGADFFASTVPLNLPWIESYLRRYARLSAGTISPTATTSSSLLYLGESTSARNTRRPMRPETIDCDLRSHFCSCSYVGCERANLLKPRGI